MKLEGFFEIMVISGGFWDPTPYQKRNTRTKSARAHQHAYTHMVTEIAHASLQKWNHKANKQRKHEHTHAQQAHTRAHQRC